MNSRLNIRTIKIGILTFFSLVFLFGFFYWLTGEVKTNDAFKEPANLFDCIYFSFITFATIGYGDIISTGTFSKILIFFETTCATLYTPVFGGYLFYELSRRKKNILFPDNIFIRHINNNIFFSVRLGNQGKPTTINKATIEFCYIRRDINWAKEKYEQEIPIFETTWFVEFQLNNSKNSQLLDALKLLLSKKNESFIRVSFSANDADSGETIFYYKNYNINDIKHGGGYINVVSYDGTKQSNPNWKNFNKTSPINEEQKQEIKNLLI